MTATAESAPRPGKRAFWSTRRTLLASGLVIALIGVLAVLWMHRSGPDYRFEVSESWSQACLGGETELSGLLGWEDDDAPPPEILDTDQQYRCEGVWNPASAGPPERLSITVNVMEDGEFGRYDAVLEDAIASEGGPPVESEPFDGWEHGVCVHQAFERMATHRCVLSDGNLQLMLSNVGISPNDSDDVKDFGPESVSLDDLALAIWPVVRSEFEA